MPAIFTTANIIFNIRAAKVRGFGQIKKGCCGFFGEGCKIRGNQGWEGIFGLGSLFFWRETGNWRGFRGLEGVLEGFGGCFWGIWKGGSPGWFLGPRRFGGRGGLEVGRG